MLAAHYICCGKNAARQDSCTASYVKKRIIWLKMLKIVLTLNIACGILALSLSKELLLLVTKPLQFNR